MAEVPKRQPLETKALALTSGEPAGIGPDIALAAWLRRGELDLPPFYLLGDRAFFAERGDGGELLPCGAASSTFRRSI